MAALRVNVPVNPFSPFPPESKGKIIDLFLMSNARQFLLINNSNNNNNNNNYYYHKRFTIILDALQIAIKLIYAGQDKAKVILNTYYYTHKYFLNLNDLQYIPSGVNWFVCPLPIPEVFANVGKNKGAWRLATHSLSG